MFSGQDTQLACQAPIFWPKIIRRMYILRITKNMKKGKFEITAPVLAGSGLYSHLKTIQQLFFLPDNLNKLWILWLATIHGLSRGGYVYSSDQTREVNYLSTSLSPNPHPNLYNMLTQHKKKENCWSTSQRESYDKSLDCPAVTFYFRDILKVNKTSSQKTSSSFTAWLYHSHTYLLHILGF